MIRQLIRPAFGILAVWLCVSAHAACAQGLIWSLPEDGTWVEYQGTYTQKKARPNSDDGDLTIKWDQRLRISSVGTETVPLDGKETACRWVEFKFERGRKEDWADGGGAGPFGTRIYKVLIPEDKVQGKIIDDETIPVRFIPVVKGFRKIGGRKAEPIGEKILSIYPMISLLMHYENLKEASPVDDATLAFWGKLAEGDVGGNDEEQPIRDWIESYPIGKITARLFQGRTEILTKTSHTNNVGHMWRSSDVPFGVAKWGVTVVREAKDEFAPETEFKQVSTVIVKLTATEKGTGARSELAQ